MSIRKSCCFTGHRPQSFAFQFDEQHADCVRLKALLRQEIESLITIHKVKHYITGMALGVDQWAAEAVLELKEKYPEVTLEMALPCETQAVNWTKQQRKRYFSIAERSDIETMLQRAYTTNCMNKRNRYMVSNSQIVLAVWNGKFGGTGHTVNFAKRLGREIVCIHPETFQVSKLQ